jgi:hypothetical protein
LKYISILALALFQILGQPYASEDIATSTTVAVSANKYPAGTVLRLLALSASNPPRVRVSRDYLRDSDLEDYTSTSAPPSDVFQSSIDSWDGDGALQAPWAQTESGAITIEKETTSPLFGDSSLRFEASAVAALGSNMNLDTATGDDFGNWTEEVNAGTGTIEAEATTVHTAAGKAAKMTGGDAHVDFTSDAITTTAAATYVLTVWGRLGAAGDLLDVRVKNNAGNFLQTDGTWAAGEVDFGNSAFVDTGYQQFTLKFTTAAATTSVTIFFAVDVSADIGYVDDVTLALDPSGSFARQNTYLNLTSNTADVYTLVFNHKEADTDSVLEYAIFDDNDGHLTTKFWWTGSAWSSTETWNGVTNNTSSTKVTETFTGRTANLPHLVQIRFRVRAAANAGDILVDRVSIVNTALTTDSLLYLTPDYITLKEPGRVVAINGSSTNTVNVTAFK